MKDFLEKIRIHYITSVLGVICVFSGVYIGIIKADWANATVAITAGIGLLGAKDVNKE